MQSILLSMRPRRCEKVASGEITLDIRKTTVRITPPFRVYLYCTKPRKVTSDVVQVGHVIGEFICTKIHTFPLSTDNSWRAGLKYIYNISWKQLAKTGMTHGELSGYGNGKTLYGLEIQNFQLYKIPMDLGEFAYAKAPDIESLDDELCGYCVPTCFGQYKTVLAPNGPIMCEGAWCAEAYEDFLWCEYSIVHPPRSFCRVEVIVT